MTEGIKPRHVYVDEMHTDPLSGALQMLRFQLYYDHARADIEIHLGEPVPPHTDRSELVRIEIHTLIEAFSARNAMNMGPIHLRLGGRSRAANRASPHMRLS
jgi:hypothetical protein